MTAACGGLGPDFRTRIATWPGGTWGNGRPRRLTKKAVAPRTRRIEMRRAMRRGRRAMGSCRTRRRKALFQRDSMEPGFVLGVGAGFVLAEGEIESLPQVSRESGPSGSGGWGRALQTSDRST